MAESEHAPRNEKTREELGEHSRRVYEEEFQTEYGLLAHLGIPLEYDAVYDFARFMNSNDNVEAVRLGKIGCLADALLFWMIEGDATKYCPSYELFLQTTIHIMAVWNGECGEVYDGIDGAPVREGKLDSNYAGVQLRKSWGQELTSEPRVIPTLLRPKELSSVQVWNHPVFRRDTFEYAQHRRSTRIKKQKF